MKSLLKKFFYLNFIIKLRNILNFKNLNINKGILNGKISVSDSFCWRTDNGFKTIIKFSDLPLIFYNIKKSRIFIIIYSKDFKLIKKIEIEEPNHLNQITISKKFLDGIEDYGTFLIFHKFNDINLNNVFISNRCYLGFSKNECLYSFVHGNTLSRYISMDDPRNIKTNLVQTTSILYKSKYKIQNYFEKDLNTEIFLANPTSKKITFKINNKIKTLNDGESILIDVSQNNTLLIESNCLFLRPIVFNSKKEYIDVYHG